MVPETLSGPVCPARQHDLITHHPHNMNTRRWHSYTGLGVFFAGLFVMVAAVLTGNSIQPEVGRLGMDVFLAQHGVGGWLEFPLFAFGFPLGLVICAIGLFVASGGKGAGLFPFGLVLLIAALLPLLAPLLLGRQPGTTFFGTAGYLLLSLTVITLWLWGRDRAALQQTQRRASDFQGAGYACFAMAAWNLCGVGGMPAFALTPERMLATGTAAFATGQMKAVMLLLLLGWLLTLFGYYHAGRSRSRPGALEAQHKTSTENIAGNQES